MRKHTFKDLVFKIPEAESQGKNSQAEINTTYSRRKIRPAWKFHLVTQIRTPSELTSINYGKKSQGRNNTIQLPGNYKQICIKYQYLLTTKKLHLPQCANQSTNKSENRTQGIESTRRQKPFLIWNILPVSLLFAFTIFQSVIHTVEPNKIISWKECEK